jgi:hypothetical protein
MFAAREKRDSLHCTIFPAGAAEKWRQAVPFASLFPIERLDHRADHAAQEFWQLDRIKAHPDPSFCVYLW